MNPGSFEAQEAGCRCPRMDNCYGKGMYGTGQQFVISADCPIHAPRPDDDKRCRNSGVGPTDQPACEDKTQ